MGKKPSAVLLNDQHIFLQVQVGLTMTTLTQDHFPQWDCFFFFLVPSISHVKCLHVQCSGNCMTRVCMDCSLCLSLSWGTPVVENPPCKCSITTWFQNTTGHGDMKTKNLCNVVIVLASLFWPVHLYASSVSLSPVRRSGLASQTESFHLDLKRKKKVKTITMIHKSGHSHSQSTCRSKT